MSDWRCIGRFVVPRHRPELVEHFRRDLYVAHGRRGRLARALSARLLPWGGAPAPGRIAALETRLAALGLSGRGFVVLGDYPEQARGREVVFVLGGGPDRVVKLRRAGAPGRTLGAERELLAALRGRLSAPLRETLPEPLALDESPAGEALVLAALPGRAMGVDLPAALGALSAAAAWLAAFHRESGGAVHGDFWPRNVLVDDAGRISGVIDWERAALAGAREVDLLALPLGLALGYPWRAGRAIPAEAALRRGLLEDNPVSRAIRGYLRAYAAAAGLAVADLLPALRRALAARAGEGVEWTRLSACLEQAPRSVFSG